MKTLSFLFILSLGLNVLGQKVYNFTLPNTENNDLSFDKLQGEKLTIIDFWATWCQPCRTSIPKINALYNEYKDKGVTVVGISIDTPRNRAKVGPLAKAMGIEYPVLIDEDQQVSSDFNVSSIPVLFFIDAKNEIVYTHQGYTPGDEIELKTKIEELIK
jgi:cytochrome c biogenesis protein CcmG, thiol:disulfide interchange protein DsbE